MRISRTSGLTAILVGAAVLGTATSAFAGADDGGSKAFWLESSQPASPAAPRDNSRYVARYAPVQPTAPAAAPVKDPPYFYHAMGTMGVP